MDSLTPAQRAREETIDEDDDEDYMPGPDVKKRLFDGDSETPLRTVIKQPVLVYLRVRPKSNQELKEQDFFQVVEDNIGQPNIVLTTSIRDGSREKFAFTNIFQPTASQKDVFNKTVVPILKDFFDGQNCLLFTYGITNSGKTHTIMGTAVDPGVLPRALDVIFNSIEKERMCEVSMKPKHFSEVRTLSPSDQAKEQEAKEKLLAQAKQLRGHHHEGNSSSVLDDDISNTSKVSLTSTSSDVTGEAFCLEGYQIHETTLMEVQNSEHCYFSIWVSFVEIYNEIISDLLTEGATVKLKEDKYKNFFIDGTREVKVDSVEEALLLLKLGLKNRHVAGTKLNYQSSRSHSIFTIKCIRTVNDNPSHAMVNRISIIDLAGTERSAKTGAKGQRVKEAGKINQSLMVLGRCIKGMRHNQSCRAGEEQLIPYRESRLTQLFQNYLAGKGKAVKQGKVSMIINVSNNASVYDESINVLRFSALTSKVVPTARPFVCADKSSEVVEVAENTLVPRPSEKGTVDEREVGGATEVGLTKCTCNAQADLDAYKLCIQQLQVELIEQESKIRSEVCQEFHQQLTEIEENHSKEMEDQHLELISLFEGRIKKLNETTKKMKGQKRRRLNDDDDDTGQTSNDENVRALMRDMELERCKAVSELKDLTETYEANIVRLNEQINAMALKLLNSERDWESGKKQCEALRLENEGQKRVCDDLRQEYMCLRQEFECQSELAVQDLKKQCETLNIEAQDFKRQCEVLKEEIRSKEEQMSPGRIALQCELQAMAAEREGCMVEEELLQSRISELMKEMEELQGGKKSRDSLVNVSEMSKVGQEIQALLMDKKRLSAEVEGLESEKESKSKLVEKIESLLSEKKRLSAEVEGLESEKELKSKLVKEIESLLSEKQRLSAEVEGLESEKESKSKLVEEIESLLSEKKRLSAEVEGLESEKELVVEEIVSLLSEKKRLSAEVEGLESEKESKSTRLCDYNCRVREAAELKVIIDQRTEEICSLKAQVEDLESKSAELSGVLKESSSMLEEMSCTLQRQKDRIAELISNIETYKSENEQLTENSIELQMQIQRATTSRDSYASQLEGVTKEYEDLKRSTSQRESKLLDTIDQTNAMIDDQMADLKKRCASLEHELAISKETNCELQLCVRGKDEDLLEAQKRLSRLQIEFLETSQAQTTRIEELTSSCAVFDDEKYTLQDELKKEKERHQTELDSILGNHQLETARLQMRVRDLEAMEAAAKTVEAMEAAAKKADKKTKALLASKQKESDDLREQVETLKREHKLGMDERAMLKAQRDELSSELGQVKEKIDSQERERVMNQERERQERERQEKERQERERQEKERQERERVQTEANQERERVMNQEKERQEKERQERERVQTEANQERERQERVQRKTKASHDAELQKMKEQLTAEVKEKEWLIAELQKTKQAESCSHDNDLDSSKPHLPLLENSQLLESFVDPVKEERVEMQLLVTPLPVKKGRGGRKRKASPPVKPADSVPHEESPVKRPRSSRRKLPTTALQQDENVEAVEVTKPAATTTYSKIKEEFLDLFPARNTRRPKLLKSQISGPLEVVQDAIGATPIANKGKCVLKVKVPRAPRGTMI